MATYTDTKNVESFESNPGYTCNACKATLKDYVVRGNHSGVVINRVRLYTFAGGVLTCNDCNPAKSWRARQAAR